ncbi:MAG TPA: FAD binding domain-containing protein [Candidatus Limnocylindrales bacterium]
MPSLARPASLDEALGALRAEPAARPVAGGVGLLLRAAFGESLPDHVVAVGRLPELRSIEPERDGVRIGAAVTLAELARSQIVRVRAPLLAAAAEAAANPGVRTTATLGGNLLDRPGASDLVATALALDAEVVSADERAEATHTLRSLLETRAANADHPPRLLLVAIVVPRADRWGFERLTTRGAGDRPAATVAMSFSGSGERSTVAAWATWIADRPVPLVKAGRAVLDGAPDAALRAAVDEDLDGLAMADDLRATAAYRRRVLPVLVRRAFEAARARG